MTSLIELEGHQILIGTRDGTIELFTLTGSEESCKIVSGPLQTEIIHFWHQNNRIYGVTADCSILCIDPAADFSCECINTFHFGSVVGLTTLASHPHLPSLLAYGGTEQSVRIAEITEKDLFQLQSTRYHDGFLGQRLGHISQVTWHPSRMIFAVISSDNFVSIYSK